MADTLCVCTTLATLSIKSNKKDNLLPVYDSTAQLDGDDTVMQNSKESTEVIAHNVAIKAHSEHSDSIEVKSVIPDGKETTDKIATDDKIPKGKLASDYTANLPSTKPSEITGKEFVPVSAYSKLNMDIQNGNITDAISVESHVKNYHTLPEPGLLAAMWKNE
ncbi:hypothetical protein Tco_0959066 [Tanacetum coccineum]